MKDIYALKLMESVTVENDLESCTTVQRVPGGWIFTQSTESHSDGSNDRSTNISSVFVPYNDEFKEKRKSEGWAKS